MEEHDNKQQAMAESPAERATRRLGYLGAWPSVTALTEQMVRDLDWQHHLEQLPSVMRPYVRIDIEALARDVQAELTIVGHPSGVWVFDPKRW